MKDTLPFSFFSLISSFTLVCLRRSFHAAPPLYSLRKAQRLTSSREKKGKKRGEEKRRRSLRVMWKDLFLLASPKEERTADRSSSSSFNRATRIDGVWPLGRRDDECRLLVNPMTLPFGSSSPLFRPYAISARLPPDVLTFSIDPQKLPFPLGSFLLFSSFRSFLSAPSGRSDRPVKRSTAKKKKKKKIRIVFYSLYIQNPTSQSAWPSSSLLSI